MRGLIIALMAIDHAAMAFNHSHLDEDSAVYPDTRVMDLTGDEFFTRGSRICAGLHSYFSRVCSGLSVERRVIGSQRLGDR
jgi:hypothetical protein